MNLDEYSFCTYDCFHSSLSSTVIPYQIRINLTFVVLAVIGTITYVLSRRLEAKDYETAQAREEVVHIKQDDQETEEASGSRSR